MRTSLFILLWLLISGCSPRTSTDSPLNRLAVADSPYLRQHATNPVDWYQWGEEALTKAAEEDKLIIVSVGYSACHWCHVMEEESFEDSTVAALMNEHFVSIKVDREQRPDLDKIYLSAAQLSSGRGGWPLNAITLPDGSPIVAATYFPKEEWIKLLTNIVAFKQDKPDQLAEMAGRLRAGIVEMGRSPVLPQAPLPDMAIPEDAADVILSSMDPEWGGFRGDPKFPMPDVHRFLLAKANLTDDEAALKAVTTTLDAMAKGGIYDHVGGGFARYSTDSIWHVPHFEKMLYDNAQLLSLYAEAYRITGNESYHTILSETVTFLQRELTDESGGLYSSLDADSEGEEGTFYVWTEKDFLKTLGMKGKAFKDYYNVFPQGNWEGEKNVLMVTEPPAVIAQRYGYTEAEFEYMIPVAKQLLHDKRSKRERPRRDDKILTSWNALAISGYVDAYRALGADSLLESGIAIADFITNQMKRPDGGLFRSSFEGTASIPAFADDYGYLIEALVDLYQVTFDERWLREAEGYMEYVLEHFGEAESPYFYYAEASDASLISRSRDLDDNVTPSTNASLARGLFLLGTYLYKPEYIQQATEMLQHLQQQIRSYGSSYSHWARLSLWVANPPYEVAIVGDDWKAMARDWWKRYDADVLLLGGNREGNVPLLTNKLVEGTTMIYVCQNKVCQLPVQQNQAAFDLLK